MDYNRVMLEMLKIIPNASMLGTCIKSRSKGNGFLTYPSVSPSLCQSILCKMAVNDNLKKKAYYCWATYNIIDRVIT